MTELDEAGTVALGDLVVRRLGFGAMRLTGPGIWGRPDDPEGCKEVLRRAVELGVTFIDTADSYGPEVSEELIAETLHPYAEDLVVATKGGFERPGPGNWRPTCRPEHLRQACEGSLARLRVDAIDVYQLHTVDSEVPFDESVGALAELREAGKIRHIGLSNVRSHHVSSALELVPIVSVQNRFNISDRSSQDVVELCERKGLAFIAYFPLAAGELARDQGVRGEVARRHGVTPAQVALAWLLALSSAMLPIPGTASRDHLEENIAAAGLRLTPDDLDRLATR
ncbi:MAG: aldo/keto reductase [Actinomycetota bacterium]|nr:aldo/keto reductase [Actinomycetota bacterium]